ncbi:hypothetical protein PHMEG_00034257, partial [Phytophthora megakarya]
MTEPVPTTPAPAPTSSDPLAVQQANMWAKLMKSATERADLEKKMETRLIHSLNTLSQKTSVPRGIILPLYDKITTLGVSLILQLRSLGVDLPIEIPHCGDFDEAYGEAIMKKRDQLGEVYVYNACKLAATAKSLLNPSKQLFCKDLDNCHRRFRNFAIKVLGVVYSRFEEIMLMDADALLFQSPMALWNTQKYQTTGTMFFNDRIAEANFSMGLGYKPANRPNIMAIEDYLSKADLAETKYAFSDFATGSAGGDFRNKGENKSIICGSAAHYFPEKSEDTPIQKVSLLYMNTDYIM